MENNLVYILFVSDEWSEDTTMHSVYKNKQTAERVQQELESSLIDGMIVYIEEHELMDE